MQKVVILLLTLWGAVYTYHIDQSNLNTTNDEIDENDANNLSRLVEEYKDHGFTMQLYQIYTDDGYFLGVHRIQSNGPPVLLMHGVLGSSQNFLAFGKEKSLAYSLAEQGYDVWIGNNRGNSYSRKHKKINPDTDSEFWDFSFHEMGYYDCPKIIDYISNQTSSKSITFIGHAQGATQLFVLASTKPAYNKLLNSAIVLSPFTYMSHIPHPIIKLLKDQKNLIEFLLTRLNIQEFLAHDSQISKLLKLACFVGPLSKYCSMIPYILGGMNPEPLDKGTIGTFIDNFPAGTSLKNIKHLLQQIESGKFQQYDYGLIGNLNYYNKTTPPLYNLSEVTVPVTIFHAENDWLASEQDVNRLMAELPNSKKELVGSKYFNHFDFFMGQDVNSCVNFRIVNLVNSQHGRSTVTTTPSTTSIAPQTSPATSPLTGGTSSRSSDLPTSTFPGTTSVKPQPSSGVGIKYSLAIYTISIIFILIG